MMVTAATTLLDLIAGLIGGLSIIFLLSLLNIIPPFSIKCGEKFEIAVIRGDVERERQ